MTSFYHDICVAFWMLGRLSPYRFDKSERTQRSRRAQRNERRKIVKLHHLTPDFAVSPQITSTDVAALKNAGFRTIICNRPDGESPDQPLFAEIETAAQRTGMSIHYLPVGPGKITEKKIQEFGALLESRPAPTVAYCRTGTRSATIWALSQVGKLPAANILAMTKKGGYDCDEAVLRTAATRERPVKPDDAPYDVVIVGGGAAGIATGASLLARSPGLNIVIIDPADTHFYQPGWTLVGRGIFTAPNTARPMKTLIPRGVHWIKSAVTAFEPDRNAVILDDRRDIFYKQLIVCPGLTLDWNAVDGLSETLGRNGVTSNYSSNLAPYTWELVQSLRGGRALFTQPPMPIKCAGAPQKAMYLSADYWRRAGVLDMVDINFFNAGATLFGVPEYVPALMEYIDLYGINLQFSHNLIAVDGVTKNATFVRVNADGSKESVTQYFDMLHVVPPQKAPDFVRASPLADTAGWVDVHPDTM